MRNPLTFQVESYIGGAFIFLFTGFCVSLIFISLKNFDSELIVQTAQDTQAQRITPTQRLAMDNWMRLNSVRIPVGEGYGWLLSNYPSHPWNQ